jgi:prepilin-type N-terminal cleavage/methylation domain-containing protein
MKKTLEIRGRQDGFTLVEIVVAMTILSIVMVTLAGLTFQTARRSISAQGNDQRQAVIMQQLNQMAAVPYDSLGQGSYTGCTTITASFGYTRCLTMSQVSLTLRRMTIIITPTRPLWRADTVQVERKKPYVNPLNTT